jgi:N-methylhydantoinase B
MTYGYSLMLDHLEELMEGEIYPGDIFIHNDPYYGNNQAQDTAVFKPVFFGDELSFWTGAKGHLADLGGAKLGGYEPAATDMWQETVRLPPLKLYERGELRRDIWNLVLANTRLPDLVGGDLRALIAACRIGENRVVELSDRYGEGELLTHIEALLDGTQKRMRAELAAITNGTYRSEARWRLPEGLERDELVCRLEATVEDDRVTLDFTGSDPQSSRYYNGTYATSYASALATLLMLVDPMIPHNEGVERCIVLKLPEGSFVNASAPAPTVMGNFVMNDVIGETTMKALGAAVPDRVMGGWNRGLNASFGGMEPETGKPFFGLPLLSNKGGSGAGKELDGWDCIGILTCGGAFAFDDYEIFEANLPATLLEHELWEDSGGAGEWRGGLGIRLRYRIHHDAEVTSFGDATDRPYGLFGGETGQPNSFHVIADDGRRTEILANDTIPVQAGAVIEARNAGGGGYGHPWKRGLDHVRADVLNGIVSASQAKEAYGATFTGSGSKLAIDEERTAERRAVLSARVEG